MQSHRHQEFIRFLNAIEAALSKDKAVHVILDNYETHKQPKVRPGWKGIPYGPSTSSRHPSDGLAPSKGSSQSPHADVSSTVCFVPSSISSPPSTASSTSTITRRSHPSGKPPRTISLPRSNVGTKRWNQSNSGLGSAKPWPDFELLLTVKSMKIDKGPAGLHRNHLSKICRLSLVVTIMPTANHIRHPGKTYLQDRVYLREDKYSILKSINDPTIPVKENR